MLRDCGCDSERTSFAPRNFLKFDPLVAASPKERLGDEVRGHSIGAASIARGDEALESARNGGRGHDTEVASKHAHEDVLWDRRAELFPDLVEQDKTRFVVAARGKNKTLIVSAPTKLCRQATLGDSTEPCGGVQFAAVRIVPTRPMMRSSSSSADRTRKPH